MFTDGYRRQRVFRFDQTRGEGKWTTSKLGTISDLQQPFAAISHVWGEPELMVPFVLAGVSCMGSAWKRDYLIPWFINHLPSTWIWFDLVSIPQGDGAVPSECLNSIPTVYQQATCVHVLLEDSAPITIEDIDSPEASLLVEWMRHATLDQGHSVPNPSWLNRLWTRQEAQFAKTLAFHGVSDPRPAIFTLHESQLLMPIGPIMQFATSLSINDRAVVVEVVRAFVECSGRPVANLPGLQRQQQGDLYMAMNELRASRRETKWWTDHVVAVMTAFPWYTAPTMNRRDNTLVVSHLRSAFRTRASVQATDVFSPAVPLSTIVNSAAYVVSPSTGCSTFDLYCGFANTTSCRSAEDGSLWIEMLVGAQVELHDWSIADPIAWASQTMAISTSLRRGPEGQPHIQRGCVREALENQVGSHIPQLRNL